MRAHSLGQAPPTRRTATAAAAALAALCCTALFAAEWTNSGGNAQRNGLTTASGPTRIDVAWNAPDATIISWSVVTDQGRLFTVKEWGFPDSNPMPFDEIVARRVSDGGLLWRKSLPYGGNNINEWICWIAGARDGKVYASRSTANGNSGAAGSPRPITALDAVTGDVVWQSVDTTVGGPYDGVVFAPNGDLIVGDFKNVTRIRATDGTTVWRINRVGSVSGNCGAAASATGVFIADAVTGGHRVKKYNIDTGAFMYQSPVMSGFTLQNCPFVSPDGQTVYLHRTQSNVATDFLYAWNDTGSALTAKWNRPVRWTTGHEAGIAADGSIYTFLAGSEFVRLDPANGSVIATAGVLTPPNGTTDNLSPRTAIGADGRVYVSNGFAGNPATNGRIWGFTANLGAPFMTLTLNRQNIGGPTLAEDGTLICADLSGVHAWRTPHCDADLDDNGQVDGADLGLLLGDWGGNGLPLGSDLTGDGLVNGADLGTLLGEWGPCS